MDEPRLNLMIAVLMDPMRITNLGDLLIVIPYAVDRRANSDQLPIPDADFLLVL